MTFMLSAMPVTVLLSAMIRSWLGATLNTLRSHIMSWLTRRQKPSASRGGLGALIGEGCQIEGRCVLTGTVMLDGTFKGEIVCTDTLVVGEHASVSATIRSATVIVNGLVRGDVEATGRIELAKTGRVVGDLRAPVIVLEEGASLEGHCWTLTADAPAEHPLALATPATEGSA
jgi:cytoskeletal protein CcmA (bactofilin family)